MRKIYSKLLIGTALVFAANVAKAQTYEGLQYLIYNEGKSAMVAMPTSTTMISGELVIPQTVTLDGKDYPVTGIANLAFKDCTGITKVVLPATIDSIEYQAFNGCTALKSINLQDTKIRELCVSTFLSCSSLESITIPSTVVKIGINPFMATSALTSIEVAAGNTAYTSNDGVLYTKDLKYLVSCPGGKKNVVIPEGVEVVGTHAFKGALVETVKMPESIVEIETYGFWDARQLQKIELPSKIEIIRSSAFRDCRAATGEIILPSTLRILQANAFYYTKISKLEVPGTITAIPANLCQYCVQLRNIKLNEGTTSIGNFAFNTTAITSIVIPNTVTKVGTSVFTGCSLLKEVTLGEKVASIGTQTFYNLTALTKITSLNPKAPTVDNYASYPAFTDKVYQNCELIVPAGAEENYKANDVWKNFVSISTSGVQDVEASSIAVVKVAGGIAILGGENVTAQVYNLNGMMVYSGNDGVIELPAGNIYIVRVGNKTYKMAM